MLSGKTVDTEKIKTVVENKAHEITDSAKRGYSAAETTVKKSLSTVTHKAEEIKSQVVEKAQDLQSTASKQVASLQDNAKDLADKAQASTRSAIEAVKHNATEASDKIKEKSHELAQAIPDIDTTKIKFSEGVDHLVAEAEKALGQAKSEIKEGVSETQQELGNLTQGGKTVPSNVQAQLPDTQPPRGIKPAAPPKSDAVAGKQVYNGPPLPLGFEPPPGYYIAKPASIIKDDKQPSTKDIPAAAKPVLPLLAPKVKEFTSSKDEPIISQLASTIDSLATSLSAAATSGSSNAPETILSKAQDDLSALSARMEALKAEEKTKLEHEVNTKTKEFEDVLAWKEKMWKGKEGEMVEGWKEEREKLVQGWRQVVNRELEGQRVGIEER